MKRIFRLFLVSSLTLCLMATTVICCCIGPVVMSHFHKAAMCNHCQDQNPNNHSSNPAGACQHQLTSAELPPGQIIAFSKDLGSPFPSPNFLDRHITTLPPPSSLVYPPGSPPLGISFTPLYLRTFNLRV
jgi:hypothetical protein